MVATERACTKCHVAKPRTREFFASASKMADGLSSWCLECKRQAQRDRAHKIGRVAINERQRQNRNLRLEHYRRTNQDSTLRRLYGIGSEEYEALLEAQDGRCAICGRAETTIDRRTAEPRRLAVDHDH